MIQSVALMLQGTVALIGMVILGVFGQVEQVKSYNDTLVVIVRLQESFAFGGTMFVRELSKRSEEIVSRHEYGHTLQEQQLGIFYMPIIALPSILFQIGIIPLPKSETLATEIGGAL